MSYELKNGQGSIFKNQNKKESKHPDYNGEIMTPKGERLRISCWVKEGAKGKFFSVSVQEPYVKESEPKKVGSEYSAEGSNEIDDLPF